MIPILSYLFITFLFEPRFRYNLGNGLQSQKALAFGIGKPNSELTEVQTFNNNNDKVVKVLLLQHKNEISRPTNTGKLLLPEDDENCDTFHEYNDMSELIQVSRCIWSGRSDNKMIEDMIQQLKKDDEQYPILLWTSNGNQINSSTIRKDTKNDDEDNLDHFSPTYIVLDATWQEAKTMFRKIPPLMSLSRLSLKSKRKSDYSLRKDFSGWRRRFSMDDDPDGSHLLCTAEVVACLIDQICKDEDSLGGSRIRERLYNFQNNFKNSKH